VDVQLPQPARVGEAIDVRAVVRTGGLSPADLIPQVYVGRVSEDRDIVGAEVVPMSLEREEAGRAHFRASVPCRTSGRHGLTVRVLPFHEDLAHPHETGLVVWAA
jgi:starch phosphorylase